MIQAPLNERAEPDAEVSEAALTSANLCRDGDVSRRLLRLLQRVREKDAAGSSAADYQAQLAKAFEAFPDDLDTIRREGLGFFRYEAQQAASIEQVRRHLGRGASE